MSWAKVEQAMAHWCDTAQVDAAKLPAVTLAGGVALRMEHGGSAWTLVGYTDNTFTTTRALDATITPTTTDLNRLTDRIRKCGWESQSAQSGLDATGLDNWATGQLPS